MSKLICPFCGKEVKVISWNDTELAQQSTQDSELEIPKIKRGYILVHEASEEVDCPIATLDGDMLGSIIYETKKEAYEIWNKRKKN